MRKALVAVGVIILLAVALAAWMVWALYHGGPKPGFD